MKYWYLLIILNVISLSTSVSAEDKIIFRNGDLSSCKILSVDNDSIEVVLPTAKSVFGKSIYVINKGTVGAKVSIKDVYMVCYEKRGNIYFNKDGQRKSGEMQKLDKTADVIYLLSGAEIPAWDIRFEDNCVKFQKDKTKKKAFSSLGSFPVEEVFMILYSDGSKDVLNDFKEPELEPVVVEPVKEEPKEIIKVIYHKVKRGETLAEVSEKYGVSPDEIIEWNELSNKFKPSSRLPIDRDIIIYQKLIE